MEMGTSHNRRKGAPVHRAVLRACSLLIALLMTAAAAAGETLIWEERLARAREKYNTKTVNVYVKGQGGYRRGMINVCYYRVKKTRYIGINIRESLQITDEAEMEAVLEQVVKNRYYNEAEYGTISFMKAQWIAHNMAHNMATGTEQQRAMVRLLAGEELPDIISSAEVLDLSPYALITDRQLKLYQIVEMLFCTKAD